MKLTAPLTNTKQTKHDRLQSEYKEHNRYATYGDNCDENYCNQCPYLGTSDCRGCKEIYFDYSNIINIIEEM